ncbi:putative methyltransferase [Psychromonas sp. CNPT3]|uniref:16S rRNA (guanine(966)-N(2))-methyltransferase RsmD n=1 Tax=Psychromonas sp. CNPT3 TaxID=314282 RepID=UPI0002C11B4F|nr:16S rRNA (guanine(966)-N(2))-methyltransferase RsmD [Psychromonas sp. CNPT3]AGH80500.1 putative methyltransferase [Psychromonas sp. CNPT3]
MGKNHQVKSHDRSIKSKKGGFIRLISGKWRGKKLAVLNIEGLRPTTDRTKETLFNWLMHDIHNANCLDCFSGSGSLAFEALSRSAQSVTLLERDKLVCQQLKQNLQNLKVENALVIETDSISYLQQIAKKSFNIIFIDPPFNQSLLQPCCDALEKNNYLAEGALIYVEMEKRISHFSAPETWTLLKEKGTGQVIYQLYKR